MATATVRMPRDDAIDRSMAVLAELGARLKERGIVEKVGHAIAREEGVTERHYVYFHYRDPSIGVLRIQFLPDDSDAKTMMSSIGELINSAKLEESRKRFGSNSIFHENAAYLGPDGIKMVYYQSKTEYSADAIEEKLARHSPKLVNGYKREEDIQYKYGDA